MRSRIKKHAAGKPQPDVVGAGERSISAIPTGSQAIERSASPKAISDAVTLAVENFLKTTFGTQDDELQNRFLMQAANIVPDFAVVLAVGSRGYRDPVPFPPAQKPDVKQEGDQPMQTDDKSEEWDSKNVA